MKRLLLSYGAMFFFVVSSFAVIGCSADPIHIPDAPEELTQTVVFLEEPTVSGAFVDQGQDDEAEGYISGRVLSELRRTLRNQGVGTTTDPEVAYDGVLHTDIVVDIGTYGDILMSVDVVLVDARGDVGSGFSGRQNFDPASDRFGHRTPEYITRLAVQDFLSGSPSRAIASRSTPAAEVEPAPAEPSSAAAGPSEFVAAAPQSRSYALVIGVEEYRDLSTTEGARRDAEEFAQLVTEGFGVPEDNVRTLLDSHATRGDILAHISWFQNNVAGGDRIYLYFSGHGSPEATDGTPYLMPYEATPENLEHTGVELSALIEGLEKTEAREIIAFVDACFSGSGERSVLPEGTRPVVPERELESEQESSRVAIFSASGPSEISGNRAEEDRGLFTHYLLEGLGRGQADMDGDGQISLSELHDFVSPRVAREARQIQREQNPSLFVADELGEADDVIVTWGVSAQ